MGGTSGHLFSDNVDYATEFKEYIDRRASQHFNNIHGLLDVRCQSIEGFGMPAGIDDEGVLYLEESIS
jgi:hypothetical protein